MPNFDFETQHQLFSLIYLEIKIPTESSQNCIEEILRTYVEFLIS